VGQSGIFSFKVQQQNRTGKSNKYIEVCPKTGIKRANWRTDTDTDCRISVIKTHLTLIRWMSTRLIWLKRGRAVGCCKHGNGLTFLIIGGKITDQLSEYYSSRTLIYGGLELL
jgi:hypothetical protein